MARKFLFLAKMNRTLKVFLRDLDLIKAAVSAHAELLKEKARAWDTVTEMIKEIYPLEDGAELGYNHISGEFHVINSRMR